MLIKTRPKRVTGMLVLKKNYKNKTFYSVAPTFCAQVK